MVCTCSCWNSCCKVCEILVYFYLIKYSNMPIDEELDALGVKSKEQEETPEANEE